jgi:uncharacterized protein YbjT (DUF2867 family)
MKSLLLGNKIWTLGCLVTMWFHARPIGMGNLRSVLLIGATGLVGSECLRLLLENDAFGRVVVLARRPLKDGSSHPKLKTHLVDFDRLTSAAPFFAVDQIICALGTTMKAAGSRRRFRAVDLLYPLTAAHLGVEKRVSHFLLVSALGANPASRFFYSRMKGELEDAVTALPYRSLTIARPSLLVGKRERPRVGGLVAGGLRGLFPARYRPIDAADVARVLVHQAIADQPGRRIIESIELRRIAMNGASHAAAPGASPLKAEPAQQSPVT